MRNVPRMSRQQARALLRWATKQGDARLLLRAQVAAAAGRGRASLEICETFGCARSQVYRVAKLFVAGGREALRDARRTHARGLVDVVFVAVVRGLLELSPRDFKFDRATWTRELLVIVAGEQTGVRVSVRSMSRVLRIIGARRGRPKPIVAPRLSKRQQQRRLQKIRQVLLALKPGEEAVYEDEVDIHLNPHIGVDWMLPGEQKTVLTPGKNQKAYIAGALNAIDGKLTWVGDVKKSASLFVALLKKLDEVYPDAVRIYVILDNYGIHKSAQTLLALAKLPRIRLVFLPPYSPDHNRIERLWQDLHSNVTRNHRFASMEELCEAVARWLNSVHSWSAPACRHLTHTASNDNRRITRQRKAA